MIWIALGIVLLLVGAGACYLGHLIGYEMGYDEGFDAAWETAEERIGVRSQMQTQGWGRPA